MTSWSDIGADGLWLPEPPLPLQADLRRLGDQRWGTRERAPGLRGLGWYAKEFEESRHTRDFVLAGREDAASNKPAVQYLLAFGALGLFIEGDVFEGRGQTLFGAAGRLQHAFISAIAEDRVHGRLLVIDSDFGAKKWTFLTSGNAEPIGRDEPVGGVVGVSGALDWLAQHAR